MKNLIRGVYSIVPFKRQIFSLVRFFFTPKENIYRHLHFKGPFTVRLDSGHHFRLMHNGSRFENDIFWRGLSGGWEAYSVYIWSEIAKVSNIIVDVGANTGVYTLAAKCVNPNATLFAFEPIQRMFNILSINILLNGYEKVFLINKAASDKDDVSYIFDRPFEIFRQASLNPRLKTADSIPIEIETVSIDTFFMLHEGPVDLLKIDVESHEPEVLSGAMAIIGKYRPTILIEILNDEIASKIENILREFDYEYFNISEEKGLYSTSMLKASADRNYLLVSRADHKLAFANLL